jgi:hypothetical protein
MTTVRKSFHTALLFVMPWAALACVTTTEKVVEQSHTAKPRWVQEKHLSAFMQRTDFFLVFRAPKQSVLNLAVKQSQIDAMGAMEGALEKHVRTELANIIKKTSMPMNSTDELEAIVAVETREHTKEYTIIHDLYYEKIVTDGPKDASASYYNVYALARIPDEAMQRFYAGLADKLKSNKNPELSNLGKTLLNQLKPQA